MPLHTYGGWKTTSRSRDSHVWVPGIELRVLGLLPDQRCLWSLSHCVDPNLIISNKLLNDSRKCHVIWTSLLLCLFQNNWGFLSFGKHTACIDLLDFKPLLQSSWMQSHLPSGLSYRDFRTYPGGVIQTPCFSSSDSCITASNKSVCGCVCGEGGMTAKGSFLFLC